MTWVLERETKAGAMELAEFRSPVDALTRLGAMARGGREFYPLRVVSSRGSMLLARWVPDEVDQGRARRGLESCSASTTATNSQNWD